ncbi:MAG: antibiotic biosynthesis monooxygenase family protein [Paracoccaceae bacterium]
MASGSIKDEASVGVETEGEIVLVNVFTPKDGQVDAFVEAQTAEYERLRGSVPGWRGNTLYRSLDGTTAVNVARFASQADYRAWRDSDVFAGHMERIAPLVETAAPGLYREVYDAAPEAGD